jgi:hypothetical protein
MPVVKPKQPPVVNRTATMGPAVGRADDFYAFGYCPDLDEIEKETDPDHGQFTWILHYVKTKKTIVERVKARLDGLWQPAQGPILAVGEPNGVVEIDAAGVREVAMSPPPPGQFRSIWGTDPGAVFACGGYFGPFVFHRRAGQWMSLPLPPDSALTYDIRGFSEREVYVAGEKGQILLWDGKSFTKLPTPTSRILTSLARLSPTVMCAGGYEGTLLAGNKHGWRIVPTNTKDTLLSLAEWDGKVFYGADGAIWSFDGKSPPTVEIQEPARWVNGLADGLVFDDGAQARLYHGGKLVTLDTTV